MPQITSFSEYNENLEYNALVSDIDALLRLDEAILNEGIIDDIKLKAKEKIEFIKDLANKIGIGFKDLLIFFKDKVVFKVFNFFKWSIANFIKAVKSGYRLWIKITNLISYYIAKNKIVKVTRKELNELHDYITKNVVVEKITNITLAGFLIYQWTSLISFTGHVKFDFDQTALLKAISGKLKIGDVLASPGGVKMLTFIATGVATGVSFPWDAVLPSTIGLFLASLVYTFARKKYPKIAKVVKSKIESGDNPK